MKRIAMTTVIICLIAVLNVMGQTTSTTGSTPKSTSRSAAKTASSSSTNPTSSTVANPTASTAATPTSSSTATSSSKPAKKPVLYWDGTGRWQRLEGEEHAEKTGAERTDKWPSPSYEKREAEESGRGFDSSSRGSNRMLRCMGPERRPCTEGEVRELSRRMTERSSEHPALASINALSLESSEGSLSCRQVDGAHCTSEQVRSLNEHVAEPLRCAIYEVASRSNPESRNSTEQNETPTTSGEVSTMPGSAYATSSTPSTTSSSNSSTQNHTATGDNHNAQWEHRKAEQERRDAELEHRNAELRRRNAELEHRNAELHNVASVTPKHTSTTAKPSTTVPKQP